MTMTRQSIMRITMIRMSSKWSTTRTEADKNHTPEIKWQNYRVLDNNLYWSWQNRYRLCSQFSIEFRRESDISAQSNLYLPIFLGQKWLTLSAKWNEYMNNFLVSNWKYQDLESEDSTQNWKQSQNVFLDCISLTHPHKVGLISVSRLEFYTF